MEAKLNITYAGANGDLADLVSFDLTDDDVKRIAAEAITSNSISGITASSVDFSDFLVERFGITEARPVALIVLRPKTPFG